MIEEMIGRRDEDLEARNVVSSLKHIISLNAGRDWGQEEKGTTEDEMSGWHHLLNGRV